MKKAVLVSMHVLEACAFPALRNVESIGSSVKIRDILHDEQRRSQMTRQDYLGISKAQSNCGPTLCPTFDAKGMIVSGSKGFASRLTAKQTNIYPSVESTNGLHLARATSEDRKFSIGSLHTSL